jgi:DeoR/GlpR family transcriptional regulator of sugar metabolism
MQHGEVGLRGTQDLIPEVRQARIAESVWELGFARVMELAEHFGVSAVTVRNDL